MHARFARTHAHTHITTHTHTRTHTHTHHHTHTHTRTQRSNTHTNTHTHPCTRTDARRRLHTHTITNVLNVQNNTFKNCNFKTQQKNDYGISGLGGGNNSFFYCTISGKKTTKLKSKNGRAVHCSLTGLSIRYLCTLSELWQYIQICS